MPSARTIQFQTSKSLQKANSVPSMRTERVKNRSTYPSLLEIGTVE